MHGIIFVELKKFADSALGPDAWPTIAADAGVAHVGYLATESYPDEQLTALVGAAVRRTGMSAAALLEQFGTFIVPDLVKVFGAFVKRDWTALDLLENTEAVIHKAVRLRDPRRRHRNSRSPDRARRGSRSSTRRRDACVPSPRAS
jgi:Haem-NO-binding